MYTKSSYAMVISFFLSLIFCFLSVYGIIEQNNFLNIFFLVLLIISCVVSVVVQIILTKAYLKENDEVEKLHCKSILVLASSIIMYDILLLMIAINYNTIISGADSLLYLIIIVVSLFVSLLGFIKYLTLTKELKTKIIIDIERLEHEEKQLTK